MHCTSVTGVASAQRILAALVNSCSLGAIELDTCGVARVPRSGAVQPIEASGKDACVLDRAD